MPDKRTPAEMLGEFLREAAVLTAVFIPLERIVQGKPLTLGWGLGILFLAGGLLVGGILMEVWRK